MNMKAYLENSSQRIELAFPYLKFLYTGSNLSGLGKRLSVLNPLHLASKGEGTLDDVNGYICV